jgi:YcxB-like protein
MAMAAAMETIVLRYDLGWEDVREVMMASPLLARMRRSRLIGGVVFAALMAESIALLQSVVTRPTGYGTHREPLLGELIAGTGVCMLLVCWSALRIWQLSPGRQARHALAAGVWQSGIHQYKIRDQGMAWRAPDRSAVFLPWSALTGVRETERLFLLLDRGGSHVRGFIPKAALGDLPPGIDLGGLIREHIRPETS